MKKPSLLEGILIAGGVTLVAASLVQLTRWMPASWDGIVAVVTFLYILYLLARARGQTGRLALGTISAVALVLGALFGVKLPVMFCLAVGLIWLIRVLYAHAALIGAAEDAFLCVFALGWAFGTLSLTHSFVWAVWSFFLTQALFVLIPVRSLRFGASPADTAADAFARAQAAAEMSIRQLELRGPTAFS